MPLRVAARALDDRVVGVEVERVVAGPAAAVLWAAAGGVAAFLGCALVDVQSSGDGTDVTGELVDGGVLVAGPFKAGQQPGGHGGDGALWGCLVEGGRPVAGPE